MKRTITALLIACSATAAYGAGFTRNEVRQAQQPATAPETPRAAALRRCFETAPKDSTRGAVLEACMRDADAK